MTQDDGFGCTITTPSRGAAASWTRTIRGFLAHSGETPEHLAAVLRADPDFALAQACRGLFALLIGRRELVATAREALALAEAAVHGATRRERLYVEALRDWLDGRPSAATARLEAVFTDWPHDPLAMKLDQSIRFMLGDQAGMRRGLERVLPAYAAEHPALGYLHGCYAFTLEEAGEYAGAEAHGRRALELAPDDAWGLHAIAHVYDMTARPAEGVRFLAARRGQWTHCNNFRFHVWWHLALMHLDLGETERVLALYDDEVRGERTDDFRDIANATSLLMRLELEGADVGSRWEELAELCAARVEDGCVTFADLHYLMALTACDRAGAADRLIARLGTAADGETAAVMANPGLPAARGLKAFRDGAYGRAFALLSAAGPRMQRLGGSHAQRDVFERIAIEAAIRSGAPGEAAALVLRRTARRGAADGYARRRLEAIAALRAPAKPLAVGTGR